MKHGTVAIFVPNAGCKHRCSFCDQSAITGIKTLPTAESVRQTLNCVTGEGYEIAFFGGSFTAVPRAYMLELLNAAQPFLDGKMFTRIRISTRPDAIDKEVLALLKAYQVGVIELGAQSTDNEVLAANLRGHTAYDIFKSVEQIKQSGFELGLQMMTGLYRSDPQKDLITADDLLSLNPDCMRVYPTAVFAKTLLETLWKSGDYVPQTVDEAVEICVRIFEKALVKNVPIIRMGLHADFAPDAKPLVGAFHPAFGELVIGEYFFDNLRKTLEKMPPMRYNVSIARGMRSAAAGQHRKNLLRLAQLGYQIIFTEVEGLPRFDFIVEEMNTGNDPMHSPISS